MLLPSQEIREVAGSSKDPRSKKAKVAPRKLMYDSDSSENSYSSEDSERDEEEELMQHLKAVWKSFSLPVKEEDLVGKWYALMVRSKKRRKTLYIAKVLRRFLLEAGNEMPNAKVWIRQHH